ncbi:MAG: aldo/keto reductase [Sphingomonas sp.]
MSEIQLTPDSVPLGKSGLHVSPIAWGMWRFAGVGTDHGRRLIEAAFDAGVTLFDTADIYGFDGSGRFGDAEALLGEVFATAPGLRDRMVLATKGGITPPVPYDSGRDYLMAALDRSLARLGVGHVDLYQIHRPDILAHPQEVARTLEDMVKSGKVRAVGVSNYTVPQTRALLHLLTIPLASHQPEFSPLQLDPIENGLLDLTMEHAVATLAWSPLGGGRIGAPADERSMRVAAALDTVAAAQGVGRAAAAYSWIMAHPARPIPIVGSQKVERVAELADAFKVKWTRQAWYDVLVASRGEKLP